MTSNTSAAVRQSFQPAPASRDPVIEVRDLVHRYGGFTAVSGLDLTVQPGECYALLGSNGAGKTTTLELIQGHREPTEGRIRVFGQLVHGVPVRRASTGIMLQHSGFAADLTVRESVALFGRLSGRDDDLDSVLGATDLVRKATTRVGHLSGGEKRRLDFATAIWGTPELVFLDEPTTGLDPAAREQLWHVVDDRLRGSGSTVVLTTHYLEEAERFADRIGIMHRGELIAEGTLTELATARPSRITVVMDTGHELPVPHERDGRVHRVDTHELQRDLHHVMTWAHEHRVVFDDIEVRSSSLEELFLDLTREDAQAAGGRP